MILTENKLKELTLAADVLSEAHRQTRFFSTGQQASVFLSHKSSAPIYGSPILGLTR